jgi:hypothetical protein
MSIGWDWSLKLFARSLGLAILYFLGLFLLFWEEMKERCGNIRGEFIWELRKPISL